MSISYVHSSSNDIRKTIYYTVNITSTKAKLFTIRCDINQAIQILETIYIVVIIDNIHVAECIFDSFIHLYQLQSIAIVKDLRSFFPKHSMNAIEFWDCPSNNK